MTPTILRRFAPDARRRRRGAAGRAPVAPGPLRATADAARLEIAHQPRAGARRARRRPVAAARAAALRDSALMVEALRALGRRHRRACRATASTAPTCVVTPGELLRRRHRSTAGWPAPSCASSPPVAGARARADVAFDGDESALHRPMGAMIDALRDARRRHRRRRPLARCRSPCTARARRAAARSTIDASRVEPVRLGPAAGRAALRRAACTCATPASACRACRTST